MKTEIVKELINQTYNEVYNALGLHFDYKNREIKNVIALDMFVKICYETVAPERNDKSDLMNMIGKKVNRGRVSIYHSLQRADIKLMQFPEYLPTYESIKNIIKTYYPTENKKSSELEFRKSIVSKQLELIKNLEECI